MIATISAILSLTLPLLILLYIQYFDEINYQFLCMGHERNVIATYQKLVHEEEKQSKKYD
jgi:hypothetical protein